MTEDILKKHLIDDVALIFGKSSDEFRKKLSEWPYEGYVIDGVYFSDRGVELLIEIDSWGFLKLKKSEALKRWKIATQSFKKTEAGGFSAMGGSAAALAGLREGDQVLAEVLTGLIAVVAEQQRQIVELTAKLEAASVARVHTSLGTQASSHLTNALNDTLDRLDRSRHQIASVEVGTVTQKGSIVLEKKQNSKTDQSNSLKHEDATKVRVDLNGEVSGLLQKLAGANLGAKVDVSLAKKRIETASKKEANTSSERFEGDFEITYHGVKISVGK